GRKAAVDNLTFEVQPARVTGFLGPNGAGKSTTIRAVLGLDTPDAGRALLDAAAVHRGRTARAHLAALAATNHIRRGRTEEVLALTGLTDVAHRRIGTYSLGMKQRLGIAAALLGDPPVLIFDEPANGLDPEGIRWIRTLMRSLAAEGRTVLVSSHLMSEMALTADHLLVIGRGRLLADTGVEEFVRSSSRQSVHVRSPQAAELAARCRDAGATVRPGGPDVIEITGMDSAEVGRLAAAQGIVLSELIPIRASLEEAFMELTRDSVEYQAAGVTR